MSQELRIQSNFARYVALQYPNLVTHADGGGKQTPLVTTQRKGKDVKYSSQGAKMKAAGARPGFPDWFCYEPKVELYDSQVHVFSGLALEFKGPEVYPFLMRGKSKGIKTAKTSEHMLKQYKVINALRKAGYAAYFVYGRTTGEIFDRAKWTLDTYLEGKNGVLEIEAFWKANRAVYDPVGSYLLSQSGHC